MTLIQLTPCLCGFCRAADEMVDAFTPFQALGKPRMNDPDYWIAKKRYWIDVNEDAISELSLQLMELRQAVDDVPLFQRSSHAEDRLFQVMGEIAALVQTNKILEEEIAQMRSDHGQFGVGA